VAGGAGGGEATITKTLITRPDTEVESDGAKAITHEVAEDRLKGVTVPSLRHDDVRNELLSDLSDVGRRQYEAFWAVQEARHVTVRLAELREEANLSKRRSWLAWTRRICLGSNRARSHLHFRHCCDYLRWWGER
jgi:hypothetical protein